MNGNQEPQPWSARLVELDEVADAAPDRAVEALQLADDIEAADQLLDERLAELEGAEP